MLATQCLNDVQEVFFGRFANNQLFTYLNSGIDTISIFVFLSKN